MGRGVEANDHEVWQKVMRLIFEVKTSLGALSKNFVGIELD